MKIKTYKDHVDAEVQFKIIGLTIDDLIAIEHGSETALRQVRTVVQNYMTAIRPPVEAIPIYANNSEESVPEPISKMYDSMPYKSWHESLKDWLKWAPKQNYDARVIAFAKDKEIGFTFRQLEQVNQVLQHFSPQVIDDSDPTFATFADVLKSTIYGNSTAEDFLDFLKKK